MATLKITRGLPGSGKTYYALNWIAEDPRHRARVNRDDLRKHLFNDEGVLGHGQESVITKVQQQAVLNLLRQNYDVIVDDTHLRSKYITAWYVLMKKHGYEFEVIDFRDVPIETCVARDAKRREEGARFVGEHVIRDMASRFRSSPTWAPPEQTNGEAWRYEPNTDLPRAFVFDIDGTLAHHMDRRSPFDWKRVGEDEVDEGLRYLAITLSREHLIVLMSGRDEVCRPQTEAWLKEHGIPYDALIMRKEGDGRNDALIKIELFREHVEDRYHVIGIFDDRARVVEAWRDAGMLCLQVAEGEF